MGGDPVQPTQPAMAVPIHARGITIAGSIGLAMFGFVKLQLQHKLFILSIFQVDFLLNFSQLRLRYSKGQLISNVLLMSLNRPITNKVFIRISALVSL